MCFKKHLEIRLFRTFYLIKSIHLMSIVPIVVLNFIIPFICFITFKKYGFSTIFQEEVREIFLLTVPLFCFWWSAFVLREYLEGIGNELLFSTYKCNLYKEIFVLFIVYILNFTLVFSPYCFKFKTFWILYVWIFIACNFIFNAMYLMSILSKSITFSLTVCFVYCLINYSPSTVSSIPFIYGSAKGYDLAVEFKYVYFPMMLLGILFWALGCFISKKRLTN